MVAIGLALPGAVEKVIRSRCGVLVERMVPGGLAVTALATRHESLRQAHGLVDLSNSVAAPFVSHQGQLTLRASRRKGGGQKITGALGYRVVHTLAIDI